MSLQNLGKLCDPITLCRVQHKHPISTDFKILVKPVLSLIIRTI